MYLEVLVLGATTALAGTAAVPVDAESPDLVLAKRLLDHVRLCGFEFERAAPGEDAPLIGYRVSESWLDLIHIEGFSSDCFAWRKRRSALVVRGDGLVEYQVNGSAVYVLNEVLSWKDTP